MAISISGIYLLYTFTADVILSWANSLVTAPAISIATTAIAAGVGFFARVQLAKKSNNDNENQKITIFTVNNNY